MDDFIDLRIKKTKRQLRDSMIRLLKNNRAVTTLDICRDANINPVTFYRHYDDKNDLLREVFFERLSLFFVRQKNFFRTKDLYGLLATIKNLLDFCRTYKETFTREYFLIWKKFLRSSIIVIFFQTLEKYCFEKIGQTFLQCSEQERKQITTLVVGAVFAFCFLNFSQTSHSSSYDDIFKTLTNFFQRK